MVLHHGKDLFGITGINRIAELVDSALVIEPIASIQDHDMVMKTHPTNLFPNKKPGMNDPILSGQVKN